MVHDMYGRLAPWWPLLSPPAEYAAEAAIYADLLRGMGGGPAHTVLELGSGGGNNASHLKASFALTLVDAAPAMLELSRSLNPECVHVVGDMRTVRLGRHFDRVFVHDAICYMTTEADLRLTIETAFVHCRPGGAALFVPDYVRETFTVGTDTGGADDGERGMRYLEWRWDPDPGDTTYVVDYAYLLREADGTVRAEHERHIEGVFPRAVWLRLLDEVGFDARIAAVHHDDIDLTVELFTCVRPGTDGERNARRPR